MGGARRGARKWAEIYLLTQVGWARVFGRKQVRLGGPTAQSASHTTRASLGGRAGGLSPAAAFRSQLNPLKTPKDSSSHKASTRAVRPDSSGKY
jgi:hypothetical protein